MENINSLITRVTALDIAKLVGVSQPTVSRVFSNDNKVSHETREKVLAAALQYGYKPNAIARSLTSQKTNIVGIAWKVMLPSPYCSCSRGKSFNVLQFVIEI